MYDITKTKSFTSLDEWKKTFFKQDGCNIDTPMWVIGNKLDVEVDRHDKVRDT